MSKLLGRGDRLDLEPRRGEELFGPVGLVRPDRRAAGEAEREDDRQPLFGLISRLVTAPPAVPARPPTAFRKNPRWAGEPAAGLETSNKTEELDLKDLRRMS